MNDSDRSAGRSRCAAPALETRLALRPREAAACLGVSERWIRGLLPELPHLRVDGVVLLPVDAFREWLKCQAKAEKGKGEAIVNDLAAILKDGS